MILNQTQDPKAWERYFKDIVRKHYQPANYRDVPDEHCGDFGVECYTLCGHVFQCYLPEQDTDLKKLLEAQKDKIRTDIRKFTSTNVTPLMKLFGDIKISRWILGTSVNKSAELTQYCAQKSLKARNLNVPYISDDFQILVHTEDDYPQEVLSLQQSAYQLNLNFEDVSDTKASDWIDENLTFLKKLNFKISKIVPSEKEDSSRSFLVQKYLQYQNLLDALRTDWGDIYEIVVKAVKNRQEYLEGRFLTCSSLLPADAIQLELEKLENDIKLEVKTIRPKDLELIKWGVVSDWLIRCPLDF
jgi:hypothetical protein